MTEAIKRHLVVTGGSRGIGRAICLALASPDAKVWVNYRQGHDQAMAVVQEINKRGGHAEAIGFDVADTASIQSAFEKIEGVDVLINNAGIAADGLILRSKESDWKSTVDINLKGAFEATKAALKTMLRRKNDGRIIFLSSVVGQMGNAGQAIYATTKAGLIGMMKATAREVASRGITANVVAPGFVRTDMTDRLTDSQKEDLLKSIPLARWAEAEEVASVVRFLVSSEASYITGQVIAVNGGMYL